MAFGEMNTNDNGGDMDVTVLGHILNERVIFPDHQLYPVLGSPAAYSSICLARLGNKVGIVTKIGRDFPPELLQALADAGVRQGGISFSDHSSRNELVYAADGRKSIKFLSRADPISPSDIPAEYLRSRIVYVCPMDGEVDVSVLAHLRERGCCIVADLGGFGGATSAEHPPVKDGHVLAVVCPYLDVAKASIEDLEYILGTTARDHARAAELLTSWGARAVVVTRGREGAYVLSGGRNASIPPYLLDSRRVIDPTGAGDCFASGFLASFVESRDPFRAAVYGSAVTSCVIERTGGASLARMPRREEADARARELEARMQACVA